MIKYSYFEVYSLFVGYGLWFVNDLDKPTEQVYLGERLTAEEVGQLLGGS
jgi:hypothetical protein